MWRKTADSRPPSPPAVSPQPATPAPPAPAPLQPERVEAPRAEMRGDATRVTRSISIKGELSGGGDIWLDGSVEGAVRLPGSTVTLGPNGRVRANVNAREAIVEGNLTGSLDAKERALIRRSGSVAGNIFSPRVAIEEGAVVRGRVETGLPADARNAKPSAEPQKPAVVAPVAAEAAN